MSKFYKWIETNIGDFSQEEIEKDPAIVHPISFDHAWEKGEKEKIQWMKSVHDTAQKFNNQLFDLSNSLGNYRENTTLKYFNKDLFLANTSDRNNLSRFFSSLTYAIFSIQQLSRTIDQVHGDFNVHYFLNKLQNDSFGFYSGLLDSLNNHKSLELIKNYLKPEYGQLVRNAISWFNAIVQRFKEARSEIIGHQLRNHSSSVIQEFAKFVFDDINELHNLYRNSTLSDAIKTELIHRLYDYEDAINSIRQLRKGNLDGLDDVSTRMSIDKFFDESSNQNYTYMANRFDGVDENAIKKYNEFLRHLGDLYIAIQRNYGKLKNENRRIGKFFQWVLKESADPGHYHFTKFDDFLNGENYEKQSWIDGVVQTAEKLREELRKIEGRKIYQVQPNSHEEYSISDLMHYMDSLLGNIIRIFAHLNVEHWDQNSPDFRYMKDKLPSINHSNVIYDAQKCLKPEYFKQIDEMVNFINRMFEILENPSFKKELIKYKFRDHTADKIVDFAKSFVANMTKLEKRFANQIEISEDDHKTIEKIKNIANGGSIKKNYNKNFEYLNNYNIFNVSSEGFTHSSDYFEYEKLSTETSQNLLDLIRAIEFSYGRLKQD